MNFHITASFLRKKLLMPAVLLVSTTAPTASFAADSELYGTWRLVGFTRTVLATGETTQLFGKAPSGFINYGPDGRVIVLISGDQRPKPVDLSKVTEKEQAELYKTTIAYSGTYTYDGKTVTHHIDTSWNETWVGTHQRREVKYDGNRLSLSTVPAPNPLDGKMDTAVLTWERIK